jgi:hypothetical protein
MPGNHIWLGIEFKNSPIAFGARRPVSRPFGRAHTVPLYYQESTGGLGQAGLKIWMGIYLKSLQSGLHFRAGVHHLASRLGRASMVPLSAQKRFHPTPSNSWRRPMSLQAIWTRMKIHPVTHWLNESTVRYVTRHHLTAKFIFRTFIIKTDAIWRMRNFKSMELTRFFSIKAICCSRWCIHSWNRLIDVIYIRACTLAPPRLSVTADFLRISSRLKAPTQRRHWHWQA